MGNRRMSRLVAIGLMVAPCCAGGGAEPTGRTREAILGGTVASVSGSPVVFIKGPEGGCTGVLVAPTLVATARHCTAALTEGSIECTPSGDLVTGTSAGQLGADVSPAALGFYSAARVSAQGTTGAPDAVGAQILSTQAPSACRDNLAFVVLAQAIPGLAPAPIRIGAVTSAGEAVSVWGYGLTEQANDPILLRFRDDAYVVAVGPDVATTTTQPAPVRALRIGPGSVTCNGDSGGPVFSLATGAVIGVVSIGTQAAAGLACVDELIANATTGPVLVDYRDLVLQAFAAAGATPIEETNPSDGGVDAAEIPDEGGSTGDAAADGVAWSADGAGPTGDAAGVGPTSDATGDGPTENADSARAAVDESADTDPEPIISASGASCEIAPGRLDDRGSASGLLGVGYAMFVALFGRKRRNNLQV